MVAAHALSVELNQELYERVQKVAEWSGEPPEKVLIEGMNWWYNAIRADDVDTLMNRFQSYSNVELWAVVYQRLPLHRQARLDALSVKNKAGLLTLEEESELEDLLNLKDYQILLRSEALLILKQRGQPADEYFYGKKP